MNKEELIEVLRQFDEKRVEELPEKTKNIFYAIMKIADERDELENIRKKIKEYIEKNVACFKNGDMLVELNVDDLLNILNKGSEE